MNEVVERTRRQVEDWARTLIDLSRRNTTLYYKPTKRSSLEVLAPSLDQVAALIGKPSPVEFFLPPVAEGRAKPDEPEHAGKPWPVEDSMAQASGSQLVTDRAQRSDVEATLRALARRTQGDLVDRGVRSLHLCLGMLHWRDPDEEKDNRSPLVFVPVELSRPSPREPYRLQRVSDEAVLNPALGVLLDEQFDISLPAVDVDLDDTSAIEAVFEAVSDAVWDHPWRIEHTVVLKRATFHKESMYRDLIDNTDEVAGHELVQSLAVPDAGVELVDEAAIPVEDDVDEAAPPERASLILDADASQRRAITAAKAGMSIVMDGPPGTGKSQTIANLIAELLGDGKRVLFVSEKSAALEVVANRLESPGLGDFLFSLYDARTSRKDAAAELGRALRSRPQTRADIRDIDAARAQKLRERLSTHAEAMNRPRPPLDRSVHWVLGRLAQLHQAPRLPSWSSPVNLDATEAEELKEGFARLARRWRPALDPDALLWRGVGAGPDDPERLQDRAELLAETLGAARARTADLATACGFETPENLAEADRLCEILEYTVDQPPTEKAWWSHPQISVLEQQLEELAKLQCEHTETVAALEERFTDGGVSLDPKDRARLGAALDQLAAGAMALRGCDQRSGADLARLNQATTEFADVIRQAVDEGRRVAESLGARPRARSHALLRALAEVAVEADRVVRPEASWAQPAVMNRVGEAIDHLRPVQAEYDRLCAELAQLFEPTALELDWEGLAHRFTHVHQGWRKLSSAYRADKRAIAQVSRSGRADPATLAKLDAAVAWQGSARKLDEAEASLSGVLGRYAAPRASRLNEAQEGLDILAATRKRLEASGARVGVDFDTDALGQQLGGDRPADPELGTRANRLLALLDQVSGAARTILTDETDPDTTPLDDLLISMEQFADGAAKAAEVIARVDTNRGSPATAAEADSDLRQRDSLHEINIRAERAAELQDQYFGSFYAGLATDVDLVRDGLAWTAELQRRYGRPLPTVTVDSLYQNGPLQSPAPAREAVNLAARVQTLLANAFEQPRREELADEFAGSFDDAQNLASELARRTAEIDEWRAYVKASEALKEQGWAEQLGAAVKQRLPGDELPSALERAMWAGWTKSLANEEPLLLEARDDDLDSTVEAFREVDTKLLSAAAERVIARCNAERPNSSHGAASIIEREAQKKRRHMPIRGLLDRTSDVAQALKPCFMMSPLTVSQFLPASMRFDVVVFDEASQVTPADAVNCIYRGRQLVITGDDKQLPPTSFFDLATFDDSDDYDEDQLDEFESIIKQAKTSAGMPSLPLRWHYRSQHEDLITFSNYSYYAPDAQPLFTFPGARSHGADLGVHLYEVEGTYRRGGARDNPVEAAFVAERVKAHAARILTLPKQERETIGVVTFSVAQADAIEHRVEQIRVEHPELEEFFADDRLDGFFVKNLESVQGDERDIMIFSVGYGPDERGKITTNFGPLNGKHGYRRLNVAITRARRRVEVVCSFAPSQLNAGQTTHRGVPDLKRYLEYAQQGPQVLGLDLTDSLGDVESPFESSVLEVIRGWGFDVVPQVGTAGYRIDLGIRDPSDPDRYILGVECDGRAYHSSRVARDRDRLRAEVLTGLGWRLHRIWGPSWYRDRDNAEAKLRAAIDEAINGDAPKAVRRDPPPVDRAVEELGEPATSGPPEWTVLYEVRHLAGAHYDHPADPGAFTDVTRLVRIVLETEAPIHIEPLARRVADAYQRSLTQKVRRAVDEAVLTLRRQGFCQRDGAWVRLGETAAQLPIRVAGEDPDSIRDLKHVPPEERRHAMVRFVADARLIDEEELLTLVARLFGVGRTSQPIRERLRNDLENLLAEGCLERNGHGMLRPPSDSAP